MREPYMDDNEIYVYAKKSRVITYHDKDNGYISRAYIKERQKWKITSYIYDTGNESICISTPKKRDIRMSIQISMDDLIDIFDCESFIREWTNCD